MVPRHAPRSLPGLHRGVLAVVALAGLTTGCRLDPECFGRDDCTGGFVCSRGTCVLPDASFADGGDAAAPIDTGPMDAVTLPDAGPEDFGVLDFGFPDVVRPDLGVPDAGSGDVGFLSGMMPAGTNPIVGTSTPTAVIGGFRDLQNIAWRTSTDTIVLSDVAQDSLFEVDPVNLMSLVLLEPSSGGANGVAEHPITRELLVCEGFGRLLRFKPTNGGVDVPVVTNFFQYLLNSPNDVVIRSDGVAYFTDPPFGLNGRTQDIPFNGLFRLGTFTATLTAEWMGQPNVHAPDGIVLSPDETRLYMTEVIDRTILVFDVTANGRLVNRRGFARTRGLTPNGMAVDDLGNVYVGTSTGIEVYADNGYFWGAIPMPGTVSDLTFGNPNRQRIYATTTSTVYQIDVPVPGPLR